MDDIFSRTNSSEQLLKLGQLKTESPPKMTLSKVYTAGAAKSKNTINASDVLGKAGAALGGITGMAQTAINAAKIKDTSEEQSSIDILNNQPVNFDSYNSLEQLWNSTSFANTQYTAEEIRGMNGWQKAGSVLSAAGQGAMTGLQAGGPWGALAGAVVGTGAGLAGVFTGDAKARREASRLNSEGMIANNNFINKFEHNTKNIAMNNKNEALLNIAAEGGYMPTGDFTNGMTFFSEGGSHEENPYQGVQQGIAPDGKPNLVEEGEWKYKDYIYSKRLKVPKKDYELLGLKDGKDYTYADAAEAIQKESEERPNDPISIRNLDAMMGRLQNSQETFKQKRDAMKMKREFEKLSPEEQAYMLQAMGQPQQAVPAQAQYAAEGGHLYNDAGHLKLGYLPAFYIDDDGKVAYNPNYNSSWVDIYKGLNDTQKAEVDKKLITGLDKLYEENGNGDLFMSQIFAPYMTTSKAGTTPLNPPTSTDTSTSEQGKGIQGISGAQALRAVPAIGSGVGALVSLFDKPNYSNIERAEKMYQQIPMVSPKPIGNRMAYTPIDINYLMTQIGNQNIGNRRAIIESGAGNPGAVANALLASNYKGTTAMGEAFKQANEYNLKQRQLVDEFNRGTDMYNADADFKGQVQNQQRANILADAFLKTGMLRDEELAKVQAGRSASLSGFFNNMGNLGTDMLNRDFVAALIKDGVYNTLGKGTSEVAEKNIGADKKEGPEKAYGGNLKKKGGKHA